MSESTEQTQLVTDDFNRIPLGFYLDRFPSKTQGFIFALCVKTHEGHFYDQPVIPCFMSNFPGSIQKDFWKWAKLNLPIFERTHTIL